MPRNSGLKANSVMTVPAELKNAQANAIGPMLDKAAAKDRSCPRRRPMKDRSAYNDQATNKSTVAGPGAKRERRAAIPKPKQRNNASSEYKKDISFFTVQVLLGASSVSLSQINRGILEKKPI